MPANPLHASRSYAATGIETTIADASPEQLILMLHDGLLAALQRARGAMVEGRIAEKGEGISKSLAILAEGLMPALDLKQGGEIAANLAALYEYMMTCLTVANLKNDVLRLDEVAKLVQELKSAWQALATALPGVVAASTPADAPMPGARMGLSFGAA
ncbi:MAG: flagellar export chaperone FliS [Proteobacteria bacterium]|nr:flagellar export chaperone FliS [Burkholderiales bacterium]